MEIIRGSFGEIKIDDMIDPREIKTSGTKISTDQNIHFSSFESLEILNTKLLWHLSMQCHTVIPLMR